ncbi:hypothetical protein RUM43_009887 [Polyplax serrata]|uniref:Uncharacterized protein n=1 Tax=Polyplax serrata TaxID=468196 RepID=A0AAN8P388_POLSC
MKNKSQGHLSHCGVNSKKTTFVPQAQPSPKLISFKWRTSKQAVRNNLVTVSGLSPKTKERNKNSRAQEAQDGEIPKRNEYLTMQILRYEMSTQIVRNPTPQPDDNYNLLFKR